MRGTSMKRSGLRWGWLALAGALALGCDDGADDGAPTPPVEEAPAGPTFHQDVQAIMAQHCNGCHTAGGAAPFDFEDPAVATAMAGAALDAIDSGRMPPWQPDPDCRHYVDERVMPADAKATFREWVAAGAPLGTPSEQAQAQVAALPEPDLITSGAEAYTPDASRPDDYRCFPLDVEFAEDTWIRGTAFNPDAGTIVHHVLVYLVTPNMVDEMNAMDADEAGPGYTCYGGTGLGNVGPMGGWVPGAVPNISDEGAGQFVPAGSRLVMQVHYNVLTADPAPDKTELYLYTWDEAQPEVISSKPMADLTLYIPANEAEVVNTRTWTHYGKTPIEVVALAPHMHMLGKSISVRLERADGGEECLVDIPDWDFNWQQTYKMRPGESVIVNPGDSLHLTCTYDNSASNQAVVNGEQLAPKDVRWGDGTLDEMCLNFLTIKQPYDPDGGDFGTCRAECDSPDDFGCVADCLTKSVDEAQCVLGEVFTPGGCGASCLAPAAAARDCFTDCLINGAGTEGALATCMSDRCPAQFEPLETCMNAVFATDACDAAIEACGL